MSAPVGAKLLGGSGRVSGIRRYILPHVRSWCRVGRDGGHAGRLHDRGPSHPHRHRPPPATLEEFRGAAEQILRETGVPGAGIALVRLGGVEWAGGIGFADRDREVPVTADTHFRVGSISKTFVAIALVQQYQDDKLDLEAPVAELAPKVAIENRFSGTPVTVLQLLQHTAGFDDMHFNEMYNLRRCTGHLPGRRPRPRTRRHAASAGGRARACRYSNPGVRSRSLRAGTSDGPPVRPRHPGAHLRSARHANEQLHAGGGRPPTPGQRLRQPDRPTGAVHPDLPPAGGQPAYLPARARRLSCRCCSTGARLPTQLVIDPEYLSNMERPRSSLASKAGLIYGYGSGIASSSLAGFPVLGHGGGIDGFVSTYGYSAARDAGWVVLLNATYAPSALDRLSELAVRYLKRDVEPRPSQSTWRGGRCAGAARRLLPS